MTRAWMYIRPEETTRQEAEGVLATVVRHVTEAVATVERDPLLQAYVLCDSVGPEVLEMLTGALNEAQRVNRLWSVTHSRIYVPPVSGPAEYDMRLGYLQDSEYRIDLVTDGAGLRVELKQPVAGELALRRVRLECPPDVIRQLRARLSRSSW